MLHLTEFHPNVLRSARGGSVLLWLTALLIMVFVVDHPVFLAAVLASVLFAGVQAGIGKLCLRLLLFALPFALLSACINAFAVRDGVTVFARLGQVPVLGRLDLTLEALAGGGMLALRVLCVSMVCALFTLAADPDTALLALRRLSGRAAITASLALRIVPTLLADAKRFGFAQRSRGAHDYKRVAVFRAVLTNALDRSMHLATTLELRGYGLDGANFSGRQSLKQPFSRHDLALLLAGSFFVFTTTLTVGFHLFSFRFYPTMHGGIEEADIFLLVSVCAAVIAPFLIKKGIR